MARSLNKAILIGNVGQDPEIRATNGGTKVAQFSLATSRSWTNNQNNEKQEKTEWHRIVAWSKVAEVVERFVKKGTQVYIEGEIQYRDYEKDGQKRFVTEIHVRDLLLLGGGQGGGSSEGGSARTSSPKSGSDEAPVWSGGGDEGDLPF